jgi:hypothetical protein
VPDRSFSGRLLLLVGRLAVVAADQRGDLVHDAERGRADQLPGPGDADEANRTAHYKKKAQAYAAAQREGVLDGELSPEHLVFMIIGLAAWWISAPQLARMLTGADDSDPDEHARRRASVVRAAERLARPRR